jgi:probable phosphomutase (TIGR03848 family)
MPIFLIIRHGENDYVKTGRLAGRIPGVHLNEKGRQQAQALGEKLAGAAIKAVYSSPLERAIETAQPIAQALNQEVIIRPDLIEMDFGEWQEKKLKGLSRLKIWKTVQGAPSRMRFPQGETFADAQHRICSELDALAKEHDPKDIVVCVSHSDPIKLAVAFFLGLPLDLFQRLSVAPGSITAMAIGETGSRLLTLNYDLSFTLPKP